MADNVDITAGSGTTIATDDITGVHYQEIKIVDGTKEGTTPAEVTTNNELRVVEENLISTNNSTTATLGSSGNFTGTGDDVSDYSTITIQLDSSHDSSASGMTFEFSTDNSNWDDSYAFTYTAADGARRFQFPVTARYFRVNYTNGGTGQTHFRVQTILHKHITGTSIHRLGSDTDPDRSAEVVKSAIIAQVGGSGDFAPIQATATGTLRTSGIIEGDTSHDAVDAGDPVKVGAKTIAHSSNPTAVAAADRTDLYANRHGVLFTIGGHPNVVSVSASYTATQADTAIVTVGAGTKIVLTSLAVYADGGGTGPLDVQVAFGTATVNTAKAIIDHPGLVIGSGVVLGNGAGIIACGADNEDLRIDATGFGTGDELTVCASYFTIES